VGLALLAVLETLVPAERVAFVLHDMFDLPFDEIAPIVGRSAVAARRSRSTHPLRTEVRNGGEPKIWESADGKREFKYYRLIAAGRKQLAVEESKWKRLVGAIARVAAQA